VSISFSLWQILFPLCFSNSFCVGIFGAFVLVLVSAQDFSTSRQQQSRRGGQAKPAASAASRRPAAGRFSRPRDQRGQQVGSWAPVDCRQAPTKFKQRRRPSTTAAAAWLDPADRQGVWPGPATTAGQASSALRSQDSGQRLGQAAGTAAGRALPAGSRRPSSTPAGHRRARHGDRAQVYNNKRLRIFVCCVVAIELLVCFLCRVVVGACVRDPWPERAHLREAFSTPARCSTECSIRFFFSDGFARIVQGSSRVARYFPVVGFSRCSLVLTIELITCSRL